MKNARSENILQFAPEIYRKRMLIEGYFDLQDVDVNKIELFFSMITSSLDLRTYGQPIVHATSGTGKESNQGFDGFVPLIDSGIYLAIWSKQKFLSMVLYTCKDFDEAKTIENTCSFFQMTRFDHKPF